MKTLFLLIVTIVSIAAILKLVHHITKTFNNVPKARPVIQKPYMRITK